MNAESEEVAPNEEKIEEAQAPALPPETVREIERFIDSEFLRLRALVGELTNPREQQGLMLDISILSWRIMRAVCDSQGLGFVMTDDGAVCGLAFPGKAEKPEEAKQLEIDPAKVVRRPDDQEPAQEPEGE